WRGMIYLSTGRIDDAASYAREALALTRQVEARAGEAHALCLAGDVASTAGEDNKAAERSYRESLALASELGMRPPRRPLPPRPRQALPAHGPARAGAGTPHHRDDDVPRDGDDVLAGEGAGTGAVNRSVEGSRDMTVPRHGPKRASRRPIGREQAPPTVGTVARTVQEAIDTGEAISVGAVNLVKDTVRAAISGAWDVGAEAGSAAVAAVRGSIA